MKLLISINDLKTYGRRIIEIHERNEQYLSDIVSKYNLRAYDSNYPPMVGEFVVYQNDLYRVYENTIGNTDLVIVPHDKCKFTLSGLGFMSPFMGRYFERVHVNESDLKFSGSMKGEIYFFYDFKEESEVVSEMSIRKWIIIE